MKIIIAGSRSITDYARCEPYLLQSNFDITEVISGGAFGVDHIGEEFARKHCKLLTIMPVLPWEWTRTKTAGHNRNLRMAQYADGVIILWDGKSTGSQNMWMQAKKLNLPIEIHTLT
jgi:hypothetical protein